MGGDKKIKRRAQSASVKKAARPARGAKGKDKEAPKVELKRSGKFKRFLYFGGVSKKELLFFTKNLAIMFKAGSTLTEGLTVLLKQSKGKMKIVLTDLIIDVNKGVKFSEALKRHHRVFPDLIISMISVGEMSGTLESNLQHLSDQLEKSGEIRRKVVGAMIYPIIVVFGAGVLGTGIVVFVLPKITRLFKNFDVELPLSTKILISVSDYTQSYGLITAVAVIGALIFLFWLLRLKAIRPFSHQVILLIPIVSRISRHANMVLFCRTVHVLLKGGVTIDEAIKVCGQNIPNHVYRRFSWRVYDKISAGESLADALSEKRRLFSVTDTQLIAIGEDSGSLEDSMLYCAEMHEKEVDILTKNLANILEPILLILVGLLVAFLALAIITPIYSITSSFRA